MKTATHKIPRRKVSKVSLRAKPPVKRPDFEQELQTIFGDKQMDHLLAPMLPELFPDLKTVALTQAAYERLEAWREQTDEPLSDVILRAVPLKGSFDALAKAAQHLPPLSAKGERALLASYERRQPAGDAWK